jgi:hypothetical protein
MAGYDCSKIFDEVDSLHVKRNQLSGLLPYRYYRCLFLSLGFAYVVFAHSPNGDSSVL